MSTTMKRFPGVSRRAWIGGLSVLAVFALASWTVWSVQSSSRASRQRLQEGMARRVLAGSVAAVLSHEAQLAKLLGLAGPEIGDHWSVYSATLMGDAATSGTGLIVPVSQRERAAYERAHGVEIVSALRPGVYAPSPAVAEYWVLAAAANRPGSSPARVGLDLAADPVRRQVLARAAASGTAQATPPVRFLSPGAARFGVIVFDPIRSPNGQLRGWVTASYRADRLLYMVHQRAPRARLSVRDGAVPVVSDAAADRGLRATLPVAGRQWSVAVWVPPGAGSIDPWLVLLLGLVAAAAVVALLSISDGRERYALRLVDEHVARERERIDELEQQRLRLAESEATLSAIIDNVPAGIMLRDLDGRYRRANAYAAESIGLPIDQIRGRVPEEFFDAESAARIRAHDAGVIEQQAPIVDQMTVTRSTGETRSYHIVKYPIRNAGGEVVALGSFSLDITAQKLAEEQLRENERRLAEAQTLARFGSWELDVDTNRLRWSSELCRLCGQPDGFAPTYEEFLALVHPDDRDELDSRVDDARGFSFSDTDYRIVRPNGEIRWVHTRRFGRAGADGKLTHLWGTSQDITERKHSEEQLRLARERLETIIAAMREGYCLMLDGEIVEVNDALCALTGFDRGDLIGTRPPFPFWPEDTLAATLELRDRIVSAEGGTFEIALQRKDGSRFTGEVTAQAARNRDGSMIGFVNTVRDVSERKRHEAEQRALRQIAELVAHAAAPAAVLDEVARQVLELFDGHAGAVVRFNDATRRAAFVNGITRDGRDLTGTELDLDGNSAPASVYRSRGASRTGGAASSGFDRGFADVVAEITDAVAAPIVVAGRLWGCLAVSFSGCLAPDDTEERLARFADSVAMAIANAESWEVLARQAATDPLTGLANHRTFHERLRAEVERAHRHSRTISVVLLDLDHFKQVNDTHGHQIGDQVLMAVGHRLASEAREDELVARIGGEEFAWLMPETDRHTAYQAAERMRRAIQSRPFHGVGTLTISAGICSSQDGRDSEEMMRFADRALYWAKDSGRNRSFLYTDEAHEHLSRERREP